MRKKRWISYFLVFNLIISIFLMLDPKQVQASNPFSKGQCTWWAYSRWTTLLGYEPKIIKGNAGGWYDNCTAAGFNRGSQPEVGAIVCWNNGFGNDSGHVAIVEAVYSDHIHISEYNWKYLSYSEADIYYSNQNRASSSKPNRHLKGYIYLPGKTPDPPSNAYLTKNQYWYDLQDTITLSPHADGNPSYYWFRVCKGGSDIINQAIYGDYSFSASKWGKGDYSAYITAANSFGSVDSPWIEFSVVGEPSYSRIYSSKSHYETTDTVNITVDSICAKGHVIGIDKVGGGRIVTKNIEGSNTYSCSASSLGNGKYSAYFSVYNGSGSIDTKRVEFTIGKIPITEISFDKKYVKAFKGDSIKLKEIITPSNASYDSLSYSSSNTGVVAVRLDEYKAVGTGKATVTVRTDNGKSASCQILVKRDQAHFYGDMNNDGKITSADLSEISNASAGKIALSGESRDRADVNGDGKIDSTDVSLVNAYILGALREFPTEGYGDVNGDGEINSSDAAMIARYVAGKISLNDDQKRRADVNADGKIDSSDEKLPLQYYVGNIGWFAADEQAAVTGLSLSKSSISMTKGSSQTISAKLYPSNAWNKTVKWYSQDTKVVTVDNGKLTAVGEGTTTVKAIAADGAYMNSCKVTVVLPPVNDEVKPEPEPEPTPAPTPDPSREDNNKVVKTDAKLIVGKVTGTAGSTVTVDVSVANNPGITSLKAAIKYDMNSLTLTGVEYEDLFSSKASGDIKMQSPFNISWFSSGSKNEKANGVLVKLQFQIKKTASGSYPIELVYDAEDIIDSSINNVPFTAENGAITVSSSVSGDLNRDGNINMKDIVLLQQYLNKWNPTIDEAAADVNKDGIINMKDIVILQQYLNGWNVTLK